MLKVNNVKAGYDGIEIIHGLNIEVPDGEIVAIVGGNGAGKSTLIKSIMGLIPVMEGTVEFDGIKLTGKSTNNIMKCGISLVPEGRQLFPAMSVDENLDVGACTKETKPLREENRQKMFELFPKLLERRKQLAGTLSGGEQQMVAMARALMSSPKLLILDEPSWGLAPLLVADMFDAIERIAKNGTSVLIVEQNVGKTLAISNYGYVIENGEVVMTGVGKDLLKDEGLKKAYLGI